jgi:hypothetical protein
MTTDAPEIIDLEILIGLTNNILVHSYVSENKCKSGSLLSKVKSILCCVFEISDKFDEFKYCLRK